MCVLLLFTSISYLILNNVYFNPLGNRTQDLMVKALRLNLLTSGSLIYKLLSEKRLERLRYYINKS